MEEAARLANETLAVLFGDAASGHAGLGGHEAGFVRRALELHADVRDA